jgi:EF-P beta-lysylation protein EpmB
MTRCETTNQSDEILATNSDFVPTALDGPAPENPGPPVDWRSAMKRSIRCSVQLRRELGLAGAGEGGAASVAAERSFPTFVPREYLARIRPGDPDDPLLKQVLPVPSEDEAAEGFSSDPVGDLHAMAAPGVLHKYDGRSLLVTTGACGIHCRYCFRREFPYSLSHASPRSDAWHAAIDYLRARPDVEEVLLSGGDPLTLTDSKLEELVTAIDAIDHVRRLRIHSRMPVVIPQRVTRELVELLSRSRFAVWFVVHINHPNELDEAVAGGLSMLVDAGIPVLNQAVLLHGVNDDAATLAELCRRLIDLRVQPYYLHQLDPVRGAAHFDVPVSQGQRIIEQLRRTLPGYAVPSYVVERPGAPSKTPLA